MYYLYIPSHAFFAYVYGGHAGLFVNVSEYGSSSGRRNEEDGQTNRQTHQRQIGPGRPPPTMHTKSELQSELAAIFSSSALLLPPVKVYIKKFSRKKKFLMLACHQLRFRLARRALGWLGTRQAKLLVRSFCWTAQTHLENFEGCC